MLTDTTDLADLSDVSALPDADLVDTINTAHHRLTRVQAGFIIAVAEFHDRDLAKSQGAPSTVVWLGRHHDLARRTAYDYLRTGRYLRTYHRLATEFAAGKLSYSKVRLLRSYLTPENEEELVDLALGLTYEDLKQALSGRPRTGGRKKRANSFTIIHDEETGESDFWGHLDAERSAELMAVLKLGELSFLRDLNDLDPETLQDPEAVKEEVEAARQETTAAAEERDVGDLPGPGTPSPMAPTRFGPPAGGGSLSALLGVINMVRSHPRNRLRAPGAQVNVLVTVDGRVVIPERFGAETSDLLGSVFNGEVCMHLLDREGLHIKLSRSARTVSPAQEKALLARWGYRCAMPGCHHSRFLEFHHILEWSRGGHTDLDNLIPLCSGCHALVSSGKVTIHVDEVNRELLRFRFPGGHSWTSEARELPVGNEQMGLWRDRHLDGAVPVGDEHLRPAWHSPDSFDDPEESCDDGADAGAPAEVRNDRDIN